MYIFKKIKKWFSNRSFNEKLLMGMILISIALIWMRWEIISKSIKESAKRYGIINIIETTMR